MEQTERELTPAEQKRRENFEAVCIEMEQKGYERHNLTVGLLAANIWGVVVTLPFVAFFTMLFIQHGGLINFENTAEQRLSVFLFCPAMLFLIVVHELIHGLFFGLAAKEHFRAISFGVVWKALTPYCSCSSVMGKWGYIIGAAMPTVILGFLLAFTAIEADSLLLKYLSLTMIIAGGGDVLLILKILLHSTRGKEALYIDHPYECGLVVFER